MTSILYLFRDSPLRRAALDLEPGSAARYSLSGMDQLAQRGYTVGHNLEGAGPAPWARITGGALKRGLERAGGYGGDFATVLSSLGALNRADVVLSTVDTVGIPLMLLARARAVRSPFVYVAIGLPERLAQLRSGRMERLYAQALGEAAAIVTYSRYEADALLSWVRERGADVQVEFVPFGVDTDVFRPVSTPADIDVVAVGGDPQRDFELLLEVARTLPAASFIVVATADRARALSDIPANVTIELDLPFEQMRDRLENARVVALPVRENTYSGATTVLLQAMALEKPVVVSRTSAIATGYGLVDGENCGSFRRGTSVVLCGARSQDCSATSRSTCARGARTTNRGA